MYLLSRYKDNHFYLRRLAELTRCFMETSPEIPILRALTNYYEDSWLLKHVKRLKGKIERKIIDIHGDHPPISFTIRGAKAPFFSDFPFPVLF